MPRSGHASILYKGHLFVHAGIHDITKEVDDLCTFDFEKGEWKQMFKERRDEKMKLPYEDAQSQS